MARTKQTFRRVSPGNNLEYDFFTEGYNPSNPNESSEDSSDGDSDAVTGKPDSITKKEKKKVEDDEDDEIDNFELEEEEDDDLVEEHLNEELFEEGKVDGLCSGKPSKPKNNVIIEDSFENNVEVSCFGKPNRYSKTGTKEIEEEERQVNLGKPDSLDFNLEDYKTAEVNLGKPNSLDSEDYKTAEVNLGKPNSLDSEEVDGKHNMNLGKPDSKDLEEGEIFEKKARKKNHNIDVMVNHDGTEEQYFEENAVKSFLCEELNEIDESREKRNPSGKPLGIQQKSAEITSLVHSLLGKPKSNVNNKEKEFGEPNYPLKQKSLGKPRDLKKQVPGKPSTTPRPKKTKETNREITSSNHLSGKPAFEKIPYDPSKHCNLKRDSIPKQIQVHKKDFGKPNLSSQKKQLLLRRSNLENTRQYPRDNVSIGIDRGSKLPRIFTKATANDFRSFYRNFLKKNLPTHEKEERKYLARDIIGMIMFCVERQIQLDNNDIRDRLYTLCVDEEFFGPGNQETFFELVNMIYNSVHSSITDIPIQRTAIPGKNKNSWVKELTHNEKLQIQDVYLKDPNENYLDFNSDDSSISKHHPKETEKDGETFISKENSINHPVENEEEIISLGEHSINLGNLTSDSDEVEVLKVQPSKLLIEKNDYKIPRKKGTREGKNCQGKSQKVMKQSEPEKITPLKKSSKKIKKTEIKRTCSNTSSSKRSAVSSTNIENSPDESFGEEDKTDIINSQTKSRKTPKVSKNDFKHHKKASSTRSPSLLQSIYQDEISKINTKNWRMTANVQFDKVYAHVHAATREGFKIQYFPRSYFADNTKTWSHIREETFNQKLHQMIKLVELRTENICVARKLKQAEIFYIFNCLKHIFWDAGFQAQVYLKEKGKKNSTEVLSKLKTKGLFSNSCFLTLKMKKCLNHYPGLVNIITKYIGKQVRWHCTNESCTYTSNMNTYFGIRSIALREEAKDSTKGCMLHYCMYVYLKTMYKDITDECEKIYSQVKEQINLSYNFNFVFSDIFDLQR